MRVGITGGTGLVGGHLAETLSRLGHESVLVSRGSDMRPWAKYVLGLPGVSLVRGSIADESVLREAFQGCCGVAHCAGINRETGSQTYERVHVQGTANVIRAAERVGVERLALVSFLRARPSGGSAYHESKWQAEELVRASTCEWTVLKPGMIFGRGDHLLDHLSHALHTFPCYLGVGPCRVRPLAVEDLAALLASVLVEGRLARRTVPVVGPTELEFDEAARMVADLIGKRRLFMRTPIVVHRVLAVLSEHLMAVPLISRAQVQILREGVVEPTLAPDALPADLLPRTPFDAASIVLRLPSPGGFGRVDLRRCPSLGPRAGLKSVRSVAPES